jgi:hypothetical protein
VINPEDYDREQQPQEAPAVPEQKSTDQRAEPATDPYEDDDETRPGDQEDVTL